MFLGQSVPRLRVQITLAEMKALVLDEVDVMFLDDTFDLSVIGGAAPQDTQFVFVTATLPVAVADQVSGRGSRDARGGCGPLVGWWVGGWVG